MANGIGPSAGMLKKVFDPTIMKKKAKAAQGFQRPGGNKIREPLTRLMNMKRIKGSGDSGL